MRFNFLTRARTNGAGIFIKRLHDQFVLNGHKRTWVRPDVQLTISAPSVKANLPKASLVRVDGIYYDSHKSALSKKQNERIKASITGCDGLVLQSVFSKKLIESCLMIDLDRHLEYKIIHNGVPDNYFFKHTSYNNDRITCITCANWVPSKRLDDLLTGFSLLDPSFYSLVVVGPLNDLLCKQYSRDNIRFIGPLGEGELLGQLRQADVFVFTSYADNCPNAVVEALAVGLPVVCSPVGGTTELVGKHGVLLESDSELCVNSDGLIIPKLDPYDIADKIEQASRITLEPQTSFSIRKIANQYERFFRQFL